MSPSVHALVQMILVTLFSVSSVMMERNKKKEKKNKKQNKRKHAQLGH